MIKRAAIYCRVSSEDQASPDKDSLGHQDFACRRYCEAMGYSLDERNVYKDAWTGTTRKRPEFTRLMGDPDAGVVGDVQRGGIDVLVVHQVDRMGRDTADLVQILKERLRPNGCEVAVVAAGINTETTEGRLMFQLMAAFAEYDRQKILERTRRGKVSSANRVPTAEKGNGWGGPEPFGYRWEGNGTGKLVVVDQEAATVIAMFMMAEQGMTHQAISDRLNSLHGKTQWSRTKTGLDWKPNLVGAVLRNRALYEGRKTPMKESDVPLSAPPLLAYPKGGDFDLPLPELPSS